MAVGSTVDVVMPQMGVSVSEGTVSRWLKAVGDRVEADETIVEISTDKVDTRCRRPRPASSRRSWSRRARRCRRDPPRRDPDRRRARARAGRRRPADAPAAEAAPVAASPPPARPSAPPRRPRPAEEPRTPTGTTASRRVDAQVMSPVVARMVASTTSTSRRSPAPAAAAASRSATWRPTWPTRARPPAPSDDPAGAAAHRPPRLRPRRAPQPPARRPRRRPWPTAAGAVGPLEEVYRFSTIRKVIAKHMRESMDKHAHVTQIVEVDMTRVVGLRKQLKPQFEQTYGVGLSSCPSSCAPSSTASPAGRG